MSSFVVLLLSFLILAMSVSGVPLVGHATTTTTSSSEESNGDDSSYDGGDSSNFITGVDEYLGQVLDERTMACLTSHTNNVTDTIRCVFEQLEDDEEEVCNEEEEQRKAEEDHDDDEDEDSTIAAGMATFFCNLALPDGQQARLQECVDAAVAVGDPFSSEAGYAKLEAWTRKYLGRFGEFAECADKLRTAGAFPPAGGAPPRAVNNNNSSVVVGLCFKKDILQCYEKALAINTLNFCTANTTPTASSSFASASASSLNAMYDIFLCAISKFADFSRATSGDQYVYDE